MPVNSGILSFGLVAIPVKLHPAIKDQTVRFHLLHSKCGSRVRNRLWCPVCNEAVERDGLIRGLEHSKGKYIQLTEEELDALEAEANRSIDLKEFVPVAKINPVYFESAYYLGPDEGGEKPFRLLAEALARSQRAAVAELVSRGKEQIVIIRPYRGGLVLHGQNLQSWMSTPMGLTVEQLLDGAKINYPPSAQVNVTFKKAPKSKEEKPEQGTLFVARYKAPSK